MIKDIIGSLRGLHTWLDKKLFIASSSAQEIKHFSATSANIYANCAAHASSHTGYSIHKARDCITCYIV